jgi:hypothetical protein
LTRKEIRSSSFQSKCRAPPYKDTYSHSNMLYSKRFKCMSFPGGSLPIFGVECTAKEPALQLLSLLLSLVQVKLAVKVPARFQCTNLQQHIQSSHTIRLKSEMQQKPSFASSLLSSALSVKETLVLLFVLIFFECKWVQLA